jgi:hypothetical protein
MSKLIVHIENDYEDGHHSEKVVEVKAFVNDDDFALECWWADEVYPHTGDGHGADGLGSFYTATIIGPADSPLVGETAEWS